jgi:integrative and conjugative element protein (TIGR02256 family)
MQRVDQDSIVFRRTNGATVKISASASRILNRFRQLHPNQTEAGGMLLGRLIDGAEDIVVDEVTVPVARDKRSRFSFFRVKDTAQKRVADAWAKSNQTRNYLGEWHSHPEDDPSPSGQDLSDWRRIVKESQFEQGSLVFLIVGRVSVRAWELAKAARSPRAMIIETEDCVDKCRKDANE